MSTIKGAWKFARTPQMDLDQGLSYLANRLTEDINFTSKGIQYTGIQFEQVPGFDDIYIYYRNSTGTWVAAYGSRNEAGQYDRGWNMGMSSVIDFGTELIHMSDDFYSRLTRLAYSSTPVSGKYRFDNQIDTTYLSLPDYILELDFMSNSTRFYYLSYDSSDNLYYCTSTSNKTLAYDGLAKRWLDSSYRTIEFSENVIYIRNEIFELLESCATGLVNINLEGVENINLLPGQDAKLECGGLVMSENIVVSSADLGTKFVEIRYEKSDYPFVNRINRNSIVTLNCKNKIMPDNLIVSAGVDARVASLTIAHPTTSKSPTITYELGMTWIDWINSVYYAQASGGLRLDNNILYYDDTTTGATYRLHDGDDHTASVVSATEEIVSSYMYALKI